MAVFFSFTEGRPQNPDAENLNPDQNLATKSESEPVASNPYGPIGGIVGDVLVSSGHVRVLKKKKRR